MTTENAGGNPCAHWIGTEERRCDATEGVRFFIQGHRCPDHNPAAIRAKYGTPALARLLENPGPPDPAPRETEGAF